jgi:hypothetical protein
MIYLGAMLVRALVGTDSWQRHLLRGGRNLDSTS